jgi:hypothetical protein
MFLVIYGCLLFRVITYTMTYRKLTLLFLFQTNKIAFHALKAAVDLLDASSAA